MKSAIVELIDHNSKVCEMCSNDWAHSPAWALYNVFAGRVPVYACGKHLHKAVQRVVDFK